MAVYDDKGVYLRLPLVVTDLNASTPSLQTKLNAHAVAEFIALAQQYHLPHHPLRPLATPQPAMPAVDPQ
jgi:hypothetical protein